ncbi:hypothetical protein [Candidatus Accumulibacter sp. ACC007]|uniref:hypothetical protein n=1 Tax=Candidatus Accumulibacter sp. ACC007 TaxID=2823333 RepID=UPI0025BB2B71|nr:hypothetical protein [Candidatus Accumulibacter sp. ACC007]
MNRLSMFGGLALAMLAGRVLAADILMAPNGDDGNDGRSNNTPVATLQRAVDLAVSDPKAASEPMRVLVQSGIYRGQMTLIDGRKLIGQLTIIGTATDSKDFPTFEGVGDQTTWLTLKSDTGRPTGLTIQALGIRDYYTAISLEGNRDNPAASNTGTTIRRNIFRNIGSISSRDGGMSTAAIRFVNSTNNVVESNLFRTIRNKSDKDCGSLHAVYVAHFSSGNRIIDNTFDDACGSVVKLRDRSNNNQIEGNRFRAIQQAPAIEEWFCDAGAENDCTKKLGECPSTGNVARNNDLSGTRGTKYVSVVGGRVPREWCAPADFSRDRVLSK